MALTEVGRRKGQFYFLVIGLKTCSDPLLVEYNLAVVDGGANTGNPNSADKLTY